MIEHDLTQDELKDLASMVKKGRTAWRKAGDVRGAEVRIEGGQVSSVTAGSDHSDAAVVRAVYGALCRGRKKRSDSAKKAAATKARRRELKANQIAKHIAFGGRTGPAQRCILCGKVLNDEASVQRGIGSECWKGVVELAAFMSERFGEKAATKINVL